MTEVTSTKLIEKFQLAFRIRSYPGKGSKSLCVCLYVKVMTDAIHSARLKTFENKNFVTRTKQLVSTLCLTPLTNVVFCYSWSSGFCFYTLQNFLILLFESLVARNR